MTDPVRGDIVGAVPLAATFGLWQATGFDAEACPVRDILDRIGDIRSL